jgi:hypothetical protein
LFHHYIFEYLTIILETSFAIRDYDHGIRYTGTDGKLKTLTKEEVLARLKQSSKLAANSRLEDGKLVKTETRDIEFASSSTNRYGWMNEVAKSNPALARFIAIGNFAQVIVRCVYVAVVFVAPPFLLAFLNKKMS